MADIEMTVWLLCALYGHQALALLTWMGSLKSSSFGPAAKAVCSAPAGMCAQYALTQDFCGRECWIDAEARTRGQRPSRYCIADEHYIPTLIAAAGREDETDCKACSVAVH